MRRRLVLVVVVLAALATVAAVGRNQYRPVDGPTLAWRDFGWAPLGAGEPYVAAPMGEGLVVVTTGRRPATHQLTGWRWSLASPPPFAGVELVGGGHRVALLPAAGDRVGLYDGTGRWRLTPRMPRGLERGSVGAWVGGELFVLGQRRAAAYHVEARRWRGLPPLRAMADPIAAAARGRDVVAAVWTGSTGDPETRLRILRAGGTRWEAIDPPTGSRFALALAAAPDGFAAAWSGSRGVSVAVGGVRWDVAGTARRVTNPGVLAASSSRIVVWGGHGAWYHRPTRVWRTLPDLPVDSPAHQAVWTGDRLLVLAETEADEPPRLYSLSLGP